MKKKFHNNLVTTHISINTTDYHQDYDILLALSYTFCFVLMQTTTKVIS